MKIYLDNAATTKPDQEKLNLAVKAICENYGNPSSTHNAGEGARQMLEEARKVVANSLGCSAKELYFVSGGTEANNLALNGAAELGEIVLSTTAEHASVVDCSVDKVGVNKDGTYDLNLIEDRMKGLQRWKQRKTLALSLVNAETGTVCLTDNSAWELCQKYGFDFHIDAVAAYLKLPFTLRCDTMAISAHKVHGLKGVGALFVREGCKRYPTQVGGGQERGLRPGTENILGAVHFGMVVGEGRPANNKAVQEKFEGLLADVSRPNGGPVRSWAVSNLYFPKVQDPHLFLYLLDEAGVMAGGKSACTTGIPQPSKVLETMYGKDAPETKGSVRFSFSQHTTIGEVEAAAAAVKKILEGIE